MAIVDFAHNPDALERTLASVRRPGGRVIAVFGATGQRDESKRPVMGAVGARLSDILIVTDDDPHDEDDAVIRRAVRAGADAAVRDEGLTCEVLEVFPRADAIDRAVALARPSDTVVIMRPRARGLAGSEGHQPVPRRPRGTALRVDKARILWAFTGRDRVLNRHD